MRYRNVIIFLGFLGMLIQFLNFPHLWERWFYVAIGALVVAFAYLSRERRERGVEPAAEAASAQ